MGTEGMKGRSCHGHAVLSLPCAPPWGLNQHHETIRLRDKDDSRRSWLSAHPHSFIQHIDSGGGVPGPAESAGGGARGRPWLHGPVGVHEGHTAAVWERLWSRKHRAGAGPSGRGGDGQLRPEGG